MIPERFKNTARVNFSVFVCQEEKGSDEEEDEDDEKKPPSSSETPNKDSSKETCK